MKIIVDINLSPRWIVFLGEHGFNAQHWREIGNEDDKDEIIATYCAQNNFIILSQDLDFSQMHLDHSTSKPSIIQLRCKNLRPEYAGPLVCQAVSRNKSELTRGAILTIKPPRVRLTRLPLGRLEEL